MKTLLGDRQPSLQQISDRSENLLGQVNSPQLCMKQKSMMEKWQVLQMRIRQDLNSLTKELEVWKSFESEAAELVPWLDAAQEKVREWNDPEYRKQIGPVTIQIEEFNVSKTVFCHCRRNQKGVASGGRGGRWVIEGGGG